MEMMIWNRELDDRLTKLQRQGRIGFHIGSVGEEALMIGSAAAAKPADWIVPCYREMGVALYRGMPLDAIVANMFGTADDPVQGRQMPCHYVDRAHNFLSISSPVGTQITQAAGVGWAMRLRKSGVASLVYFGDGATSEGDFHVGVNFAGVYRAATVFICRNNQWAISTPLSGQTASKTIAQKSIAYGIPGERVDGNDVLAVYQATSEALDRARRGDGATLLEMLTYRLGAHSTSDDPRAYRNEQEVEPWRQRDPIERFRAYLGKKKLWDPSEDERIKAAITERLHAAIEKAEKTPPPSLSSLFSDVFREQPWHLREQQAELEAHLGAGYVASKGH
ncbi:MAG: thiamine pyrophosphate-dependent dehydrogenase E1 component subunit alpha [Deltaproteobacteria bacterium]|nr:thiamine pyrophosphate-dependent dehydrogenase E1 component subunit alpha [Deltaproteobacteria bacterium]